MHGHVERRHRHREVHRVPEPEAVLVGLAPRLREERVVRVHLLPALAAGRRLDLVRARERGSRLLVGGHGDACIQHCRDARDPPADARRARRCSSSSTSRRPEPAPTEVLVRVRAAGVNPVDWKTRARGGLPRRAAVHVGWDVAGVVEEVGGGVTRLRRGRPRLRHAALPARGGRATPSTSRRRHASSRGRPSALSDVEAAALPLAGLTAWQALVETADVEPGHRVLVLGRRAASGISRCRSRRRAAPT